MRPPQKACKPDHNAEVTHRDRSRVAEAFCGVDAGYRGLGFRRSSTAIPTEDRDRAGGPGVGGISSAPRCRRKRNPAGTSWRLKVADGVAGRPGRQTECNRPVDFVHAIRNVAKHASRVGQAEFCFRDRIGAAWQPRDCCSHAPPAARDVCARSSLLPVIRAKVGKHWIARPRLMLCLWKQRCCTSTPTSSCTDSRTAPAMQRSRARRRDE
jgi:hypothetical protein